MPGVSGAIQTKFDDYLDRIGERIFLSGDGISDAGVEVDLINATIPALKTRHLRGFEASSAVPGVFTIYHDTDIIMTKRTAPGSTNVSLKWEPTRPIAGGDLVRVTFKAFRLTGSDAEAYLFASDI